MTPRRFISLIESELRCIWLTPSGDAWEVNDHTDQQVVKFLEKNGADMIMDNRKRKRYGWLAGQYRDKSKVYPEMYARGYARVKVATKSRYQAAGVYVQARTLSRRQLSALTDIAIENQCRLVQEFLPAQAVEQNDEKKLRPEYYSQNTRVYGDGACKILFDPSDHI